MTDREHEGMNKCTKCGEWKPATLECFHGNKTQKDGLASQCKDCAAAGRRVYEASNIGRLGGAVYRIRRRTGATIYLHDMTDEEKETLANQYVAISTLEKTEKELLAASGKRRCPACDRILDYGCFNKNIIKNYGVDCWCMECRAEYRQQNKDKTREYYQQNKDKIKDKKKEYYEKNKDKIKDKNKEYYRKYYEKNKEKIIEQKSEYYKKNTKALDKTKSIPDNRV